MSITFEEKSTLGCAWFLEVLCPSRPINTSSRGPQSRARRIRGPILIGHIRKGGALGTYQYFHGPHNDMNYEFQEADLEKLKRKVSEKYDG